MSAIHFLPCEKEIFAKREFEAPSKWASKKVIVQDGLFKGSPMRMDVAPYMPGILDMYAQRGVEEIIVCGALQIGKTLILYACMGWAMDYRPGTKMLTMPTKDTRDRVAQEKLVPLFKGSPFFRKQLVKPLADRLKLKNGQNIWLASAESPSQRASITVQDLFLDEEDLYGASGEGSPVEDFKGRTRSFGSRAKILRVSQPKGDADSSIWQGLTKQADLIYCYEMRCPACNGYHLPDVLTNLRSEGEEKDPRIIRRKKMARYHCPLCSFAWSDHIRDIAVQKGRWQPYTYHEEKGFLPAQAVQNPRTVGFHVPAILARSVSLSDILSKKIKAESEDNEEKKRQFYNDELGAPYTPVTLVTHEEKILERRELWLPPRAVPFGTVALTLGVDVQQRGFWFLVKAWMPNLSSYIIDYGSLETWDDVYNLAFNTYYPVVVQEGVKHWHEGYVLQNADMTGELMPIWRGLVDTGGTKAENALLTRTEEVYLWVRENGQGVLHASKGASRAQISTVKRTVIERMPHNSRPIPEGLPLYMLDTGVLKTMVMKRLISEESKQKTYLNAGADGMLATHLSSEKQVKHNGRYVWERVKKDNHLFDCEILATACADVTFTPSLPAYVQQLKMQERAAHMQTPARKPRKQKAKPQAQSRWG